MADWFAHGVWWPVGSVFLLGLPAVSGSLAEGKWFAAFSRVILPGLTIWWLCARVPGPFWG